MVLLLETGSRLTGRPDDLGSMRPSLTQVARQPTRVVYDKLDVINVPPRQFVRKELKERFDRDEALAPASGRYKQIVLEGKRPALPLLLHPTYREVIPEPCASPTPSEPRGFGLRAFAALARVLPL